MAGHYSGASDAGQHTALRYVLQCILGMTPIHIPQIMETTIKLRFTGHTISYNLRAFLRHISFFLHMAYEIPSDPLKLIEIEFLTQSEGCISATQSSRLILNS
jgi:hypothetical protein